MALPKLARTKSAWFGANTQKTNLETGRVAPTVHGGPSLRSQKSPRLQEQVRVAGEVRGVGTGAVHADTEWGHPPPKHEF
jgi:hypothetical protein